jgi:aryl-alcohol dehydrogenase-like predicted oxidoreductase
MNEKLHLTKEENFYSKVWLGTWRMGGDITPDPINDDERDIEAIRYAIKKGIAQIDTSESYAGGKTEMLIGEAIRTFPRDKICIATKVREYNLKYNKILKSCENSLKRLKTSYIDVYYIHKQNPHASILEVTKALNKLLDLGYIKHIGLSNVGIETIEKYSKFLNTPIYAVQNQYNLVCRESQRKGVIDYCRKHNIRFIAWRPIMLLYPGCPDPFYPRGTYKLLDEIAEKYNKTNIQIAVK